MKRTTLLETQKMWTCHLVSIHYMASIAGLSVAGFVKSVWASSALMAEALGVREALQHLHKYKELQQSTGQCTLVETDSLSTVDVLTGRAQSPWDVQDIMEECKFYLAQVSSVRAVYCPDEANQLADC